MRAKEINDASQFISEARSALTQLRTVGEYLADNCRSVLAGLNVAMQIVDTYEKRINDAEKRLLKET